MRKKFLLVLTLLILALGGGGKLFAENGNVAKVGNTEYATIDQALAATKTMTGDVTVEIYDKVTFNQPLIGDYTSINFVGKDTDAEMYLDVQGYTTATGKEVTFTDLKLSKSVGGYIANAGFMNVAFGIYDVVEVTYTNCTFLNGACASSGKVTFNGCTFYRSHDKYGLWAYGNVDITVDGSTFADYCGIKMYAEGKQGTVALTVKNTNFSAVDNKPAIVLTYGESVVLEGNTYSSTGVFELDLDGKPNGVAVTSDVAPVCVNDKGACGVLVDGTIYTTVAQAAEVATSGSTVTLLHNSTETVKFPMGVTLEKNGFEANGVTVVVPVAQIGEVKYETFQAALNAIGSGDVVINLLKDVTMDITAWQTLAIGAENTPSITIDGENGDNDFTLTFNKLNSDWNHIATSNDNATKLILKNLKLADSGKNNGPWNRYDHNFACDVELTNVVSNKALAFKAGATLNNVTINETGDNYAIWIQPNGQDVNINGLTVVSAGRGIKIDNQYVGDAQLVNLSVKNAQFETVKKAAIVVKSPAGANIVAENVDITKVAADSRNLVWVDEDGATDFGMVTLTGGTVAQEGLEGFVAAITKGANVEGYYKTLQKALNDAVAGTGNVTVTILKDINLTGIDWNPVTVSAPGYPVVTVEGNNKTITGLNDMLFAATWAGNSGLIIKNLTIENSTIENDKNDAAGNVGVGAFVGYPQASAIITLENCHLKNSSVEGGHWTGGLIGMAGGYNGADGPVFMNLTIKGCSVTGSTITGKGSVGGVIGHGSCSAWTNVVIEETTVSGNTITSTGTSVNKAGAVMGTIGAAGQATTVNGVEKQGGALVAATVSGNTVKSNGTAITTIYGRQGTSTGVLELNGGSYDNYPIEEGVAYAKPIDGYKIKENNGTYGIVALESKEYEVNESFTLAQAIAQCKADGTDIVTYKISGAATLETGFSHGIVDFGGKDVTIIGKELSENSLTIVGGGVPDIKGVAFKNITIADEGTYLPTANEFMYQNFIDCTFENVKFEDGIRLSGNCNIKDCTVNANTANEYAIWLDAGQFEITGTNVEVGNDAYGMIKSDSAEKIVIKNNTFTYLGNVNKEALNTKGAVIIAEGNTFIDCAKGIVPADKQNYTEDGNQITDAIIDVNNEIINYVAQIGTTKYETLATAVKEATAGQTIELLWSEGKAPIAMNASLYGKSVTITGTATVDWSKGFLFVGRGGAGNATLTFDGANLTSASDNASTGIHVSGREKGTNNKYDGTVVIKNSTIVLDYLNNKGAMTLDNATLTVKNGFAVGGRPASETESGEDATATLTLSNNSKVVVNNHNGMGLGYEAIGVMNIDETSTFETTQSFLVTAKGTINNAGTAKVEGTLTNKGTINFTAATATLYAQEGLTINTALESYDVIYEDGAYKLNAVVAKIGDAKVNNVLYPTLADAYNNAAEGSTITLLRDAQGAGIVIDKDVTIDFNGHAYTFSELGVGSGTLTSNGFQILKGNNVTLKNGTLNVAEAMKAEYYILVQNYANLNVLNMTLDGTNLDKWSTKDGDSYVLSNNSGNVNIVNTTITANDGGAKAFAFDVCKKASYEAPVVTLDAESTINGRVELSGGQFYPAKAVTVSMTKAVESYQVADNKLELESGWYTISAPFAVVTPALTEGYELFRYNEAEAMWENHKNQEHNTFGLQVGRGYLYAHANGADLNLEGVANINGYSTELSYTTDATHELKGFHLVGNPYTFSISGNHFSGNVADGFYTLANSGAWVVKQTADEIVVGEGFLVQAISTTDFAINKEATKTRSADNGSLQINVANDVYSDVAYVSFNEGVGLNKISHQNTNIPMVYVPVEGENYSIAYMNANVEEIPFAFEAKTMGSYTISVEAQNCEFSTMTLIDRFTGIETNLLFEDYSFIAKSSDNSDRFIIRLSQGTTDLEEEHFAYINNNGLIINNASSNATLQIFDVMGRPVSSHNLSGNANIAVESLTNGVYILRLIDDNKVRVQKVVID